MALTKHPSLQPSTHWGVAASLALTLGFFGPARIFLSNADEFAYDFGSLLPFLAVMVLALMAICILLLKFSPQVLSEKLLALFLAMAVLLWLQGNILLWNYGLLDGHDIEWGRNTVLGCIDAAIWLLLLLLAFLYSTVVKKIARPLSWLLIAAQIMAFAFIQAPASARTGMVHFGISHRHKFSFSPDRNVIIVVLDTFQSDIFQEILMEDREVEKVFSGFTYFRNAISGSSSTQTSIPEMLTARQYDNSLPMSDFLKKAYLDGSLPLLLKRNKYRCDLFPLGGIGIGMHLDPKLASNLKDRFPPDINEVAFLIDLSLFRQMPHFIKIPIYHQQSWFFSRIFKKTKPDWDVSREKRRKIKATTPPDRMFVEAMAREVEADSRQPTFKFYHLRGLHPPLHMNESCQPERMAFNRPNFKRQAKGELKLMSSFVSLLKRIGAFRNSLIFIVGDHGPGNWGLCDINLGILGRASSTALPVPGLLEIKASALPLMLVKPANDPGKKPLLISDAPVGLGDIPATAAAAVGLKADFPGRPLFSVKAAEDRRRRFLYHEGFASDKQGYLEAIQEYWVRGFSWLDESWHIASNKYLPSWKNHDAKSVLGNSQ